MQNLDQFSEEIYTKYLSVINNIKFTPREIDVITCILHGKSSKSIAQFLSKNNKTLGEKSIETHILNIRRKIGGSSRESIINFVEKSDKYKILLSYYSNLLIQKEFMKSLLEISFLVKESNMSFVLVSWGNATNQLESQYTFTNKLYENLKFIGSEVSLEKKEEFSLLSIRDVSQEKKHIIHIVPKITQKIVDEKTLNSHITKSITVKNTDLLNNLFLLPKTEHYLDIILNLEGCDYIELSKQNNYYLLFFEILKKFLVDINLNETIVHFQKRYDSLMGAQINIIDNSVTEYTTNFVDKEKNHKNPKFAFNRYSQSIFLAIIIIISILIIMYYSLYNSKLKKQEIIISGLNKLILMNETQALSADNVAKHQMQQNQSLIKQTEEIIKAFDRYELQNYLDRVELSSNKLVVLLYSIHALANYYTYNEHDGQKSRNILEYGKTLAEQYVLNRSKVKFNFFTLNKEEIYTELSVIKDLPEIYTRIMYALGRSHLYQGSKTEASKYFKLSEYLGYKTNLFEGNLSKNGLEICRYEKIKAYIANKEYDLARTQLNQSVQTYIELRNDYNSYKLDYNPSWSEPKTIIPAENTYNRIECSEKIVRCLTKLLQITDNIKKQHEYIEEIKTIFLGNQKSVGILTQLGKVLNKKAASTLNILGNSMLQLDNLNIDLQYFKNSLIKTLGLVEGNNLDVIGQIFDLSSSLSRNTEFTKADAYDGLIKVYSKKIAEEQLTTEEKNKLLLIISELKNKRDSLNKILKRENYTEE
jgi:hypothetical protein